MIWALVLIMLGGVLAGFLHVWLKKRISFFPLLVIEIVLLSVLAVYLFIAYELGFTIRAMSSFGYSFLMCLITFSHESGYEKIKNEANRVEIEKIELNKHSSRVWVDAAFAMTFIGLSVLYFVFNSYDSVWSLILLYTNAVMICQLLKKAVLYRNLEVYFSKETNCIYILSNITAKRYPLSELSEAKLESNVDVLKLFPLFTMFSTNEDFTTSMGKTLKLVFSGETVYFNAKNTSWLTTIESREEKELPSEIAQVEVLPFYHKKNIKRLLGKMYFAISVKGVGAYTTLTVILSLLKVPIWAITIAVIVFWIFNLYISDRLLKIALDVKEIDDPNVLAVADKVLSRAGISDVKVFQTEANELNGFAAGANIGRSMIVLTSETLKLPLEAIEAVFAHEAVHVKKRDVMIGQIIRILALLVIVLFIYSLYHSFLLRNESLLFYIVFVLILFFPLIQSLLLQWMEVRADHLGAIWLDNGNDQMADGLTALAVKQDELTYKAQRYNLSNEEKNSSIERDSWFFRFLEFQFMIHPPMYWRIQSLKETGTEWNMKKIRKWWKERFYESLPDKKNKMESM